MFVASQLSLSKSGHHCWAVGGRNGRRKRKRSVIREASLLSSQASSGSGPDILTVRDGRRSFGASLRVLKLCSLGSVPSLKR